MTVENDVKLTPVWVWVYMSGERCPYVCMCVWCVCICALECVCVCVCVVTRGLRACC